MEPSCIRPSSPFFKSQWNTEDRGTCIHVAPILSNTTGNLAILALLTLSPGWSYTIPVLALIHGNSPAHHQKFFSSILLPGTSIGNGGISSGVKDNGGEGQYVTAIQLLKMSAIPAPPSRFGGVSQSRFVEKEETALKVWGSDCIYAQKYRQWHSSVVLREDEVDDFVKQVSHPDRD